jgi:1-acyl-sn-glycerol-3-phosphate acyltransferase
MTDRSDFDPAMPPMQRTLLWRVMQMFFWIIATLLFNLKVYNRHNVPRTGPVLLLANHQSYMDPVVIAVKLDRAFAFMARSELFKPWGFRWFIRNLHAFPVQQGKGDVGALKQSIAVLQAGRALIVFPEGGRTENGEIQPFQPGASLVIKRAKVPVLPVYIDGAFEAWPIFKMLPTAGRVRVIYGEPMNLDGLDGKEALDRVATEIRRLRDELRARPA